MIVHGALQKHKQHFCWKVITIMALLWLTVPGCDTTPHDVQIPMRDGTELPADIYLPRTLNLLKKVPTVLIRTPYGKENLSFLGSYAAQGYAVVIQDMRMRQGIPADDFFFFRSDGWGEYQDGYDTASYCRESPWSNGRVVTYGNSALGIVQYLLAGTAPDGLEGQLVITATPDLYDDLCFPGGAFRKNDIEYWLTQKLGFSPEEKDSILAREIYSHRIKDHYWNVVDLITRLSYVKAPVFHMGGWFDLFIRGTIKGYKIYHDAGIKNNYLVIGPWTHHGFQYGHSIPDETIFEINGIKYWPESWQVQWGKNPGEVFLDRALLNDFESFDWPAVTYYVMGSVDSQGHQSPGFWWCYADEWPPPGGVERTYYLQNNFLLDTIIPSSNMLSYAYDPSSPVPTICGRFLDPQYSGICDVHSAYDSRSDMLYFETTPLDQPVEVTGDIALYLEVMSDREDTDFTAFLVDVYPDGSKVLITEGIMRARYRNGFDLEVPLIPGEPGLLKISLGSTSMIFNQGHKIGLYVSSSNFPGYETNPNTGIGGDKNQEVLVAENKIITGENSFLVLPMCEKFSCNPLQ